MTSLDDVGQDGAGSRQGGLVGQCDGGGRARAESSADRQQLIQGGVPVQHGLLGNGAGIRAVPAGDELVDGQRYQDHREDDNTDQSDGQGPPGHAAQRTAQGTPRRRRLRSVPLVEQASTRMLQIVILVVSKLSREGGAVIITLAIGGRPHGCRSVFNRLPGPRAVL